MPTTPKIAFAVLAGYALGRTRKMKLAITLAGLGASRRIGADPKQLLQRGAEFLDSPELTNLGGDLRGRLYDAAKAATTTAAANRVDSITRKLDQRAESLRGSGETDRSAGAADPAGNTTEDADPQRTERGSPEQPADGTAPPEQPASRGGAQRRPPATSAAATEER